MASTALPLAGEASLVKFSVNNVALQNKQGTQGAYQRLVIWGRVNGTPIAICPRRLGDGTLPQDLVDLAVRMKTGEVFYAKGQFVRGSKYKTLVADQIAPPLTEGQVIGRELLQAALDALNGKQPAPARRVK